MKIELQVSNRQLFVFILAMAAISCIGYVYSAPPNPGHSASQIEFTTGSVPANAVAFTTGSVPGSAVDFSAGISRSVAVMGSNKFCVGNSNPDCSGAGGVVISSTGIVSSGGRTPVYATGACCYPSGVLPSNLNITLDSRCTRASGSLPLICIAMCGGPGGVPSLPSGLCLNRFLGYLV
jgi:hypothetical protein